LFSALLRDLVARGRAVGIIVVAATQRPSSDIIPTSLRDLFAWRFAGRCTTDVSSDIVLGHGWANRGWSSNTISPTNPGAGLLIAEGGVLVLLLAYGGLRIGEALPLRRKHLNIDAGRIVVAEAVTELPGGPIIDTPKNHQRRELAVPAFVVAVLREHLAGVPDDPDAFLFPGRQGHTIHRQQSYHGFRSRFGVAVEAAGLGDVTPHDLRATHATWVADSHGVLVAARRLGHSNASVTTRHYARPVDGRDLEVARHLDQLGAGSDDSSGTQRARKSRQDGE
jgi:hypothetical protein